MFLCKELKFCTVGVGAALCLAVNILQVNKAAARRERKHVPDLL
jgi:hypothetical protein